MKKRLTASFSGRVQGVGFRFTVQRISRRFEVTGTVRNLPDGKVEVIAEGDEAELKDFLNAIRASDLSDYIQDIHSTWSEAESRFQSFGIAF